MKTPHRLLFGSVLLLFAATVLPGAIQAQSPKIFVASFGNDANDGSRGAPKRKFQAAHDALAVDGEIIVLDTGFYGGLTTNKAITITAPHGVTGFVSVTGNSNGITINAPGAVLRGLTIEGGGQNATGTGIAVASTNSNVVVDDCTVRSFHTGIALSTANASSYLLLSDSGILGCYDGLLVSATNRGENATITHCRFELNSHSGLSLSTSIGPTDVYVAESVFTKNNIGIISSGLDVDAFANVYVSDSTLTANTTGVLAQGRGRILSRSNNTMVNPAGNAFQATYSAQ